MKTTTRARLLELARERGAVRPVELVASLGVSPQAIHRHLRALLEEGRLERRGRGPLTRYAVAGAPRLDSARRWCAARAEPSGPTALLCETRDVFTARLGRLAAFKGAGLADDELALAIAAVGEVGNNCFDHNLGKWRDAPGCWFESQATGGRLWVLVADRGQGVLRSLSRADPALRDDQAALVAAFERVLSGRAPESRGNGLKFVRNVVAGGRRRGLACRSGSGLVDYGTLGEDCRAELAGFPPRPGGTATLFLWSVT